MRNEYDVNGLNPRKNPYAKRAKQQNEDCDTRFDDVTDPFHSGTNISRIERAIQSLESGKGKAHDLIED